MQCHWRHPIDEAGTIDDNICIFIIFMPDAIKAKKKHYHVTTQCFDFAENIFKIDPNFFLNAGVILYCTKYVHSNQYIMSLKSNV